MAFDTYLKDIRTERNVNQTQMAEILDISRTAIKLIENGSTKYPSKKVLHNLSVYLNQSELDVMAKILFTDKSLDDKTSDEYFVCSYLTHMYLEGWNIVNYPYKCEVNRNLHYEFDGKIKKKREPKNIVIVTTFKRHLYRITKVTNEDEAMGYIGDLASSVMSILEPFRRVHLLFDAENENEVEIFNMVSKIRYNSKLWFEIEVVLFNRLDAKIISSRNLMGKK